MSSSQLVKNLKLNGPLYVCRFAEAERDASKSLDLLPAGNAKALFRRATARKALGKANLARQDFKAVLAEDPKNEAAKNELESLSKPKPNASAAPSNGQPRSNGSNPQTPSASLDKVSNVTFQFYHCNDNMTVRSG